MKTRQPIWIECEGTGSLAGHGYCPMCGTMGDDLPVPQVADSLLIDTHPRKDILAMIERGDFDNG